MAVLLPYSISPSSSKVLGILLALVHGLAASSLWACDFSGYVNVVGCIALSLSFVTVFSSQVVRSDRCSILTLTLHSLPDIELAFRDGSQSTAKIDGSSTVVPLIIVLRLREERRTRSVLLLPDMVSAESWRHLSILLRTLNSNS